jgi:uncharacterized glyoxalase superfamily protein PhnB
LGTENGYVVKINLNRFQNKFIPVAEFLNSYFSYLIFLFFNIILAEVGGVGTQSAYVVVEDCDAHYARAVAAGAEVLLDIVDRDYGGRGYSCRDPEGHVWSFGSYDPWA